MRARNLTLALVGVAAAAVVGVAVVRPSSGPDVRRRAGPVAVEVASVSRAAITRRRTYGGSLEASGRLVVSSKIAGHIEALEVDLGDEVRKDQVVARLDAEELHQLALAARAELRVRMARAAAAREAAGLATREQDRLQALRDRGVVSAAQLDAAKAEASARRADVEIAEAEVARARADRDAARTRLGYAELRAGWRGGTETRWVAARHAREGDTVAANDPVLTVVGLDPLVAVISAAEADHRFLKEGLRATLEVSAFPGRAFAASVARVPAAYEPGTRQARLELTVSNPDRALAPGMFAQVTVELETVEDALVVPFAALTQRAEQPGVFSLDEAAGQVRWIEVKVGLRDGDRLQILSPELAGRVVVLGQRLLDDGSAVVIPEPVEGSDPVDASKGPHAKADPGRGARR